MFFFIRFIALSAVSFLMKPQSQRGASASKTSLNDFDFTTNSSSRTVPELFGRVKTSGNLIYAGDLKNYEITEDGGKKRGEILTGYRTHMTVALAFCKRRDYIKGFYLGNNKVEDFNQSFEGVTFLTPPGGISVGSNLINKQIQTGTSSGISGSNYGKSSVTFYNGDQSDLKEWYQETVVTSNTLTDLTGKRLLYKDTFYIVLNNAFIGDNVKSLPEYKVILENTFFNKKFIDARQNNINWDESFYNFEEDGEGNLHPFDILKYLFVEYLNKEEDFLNYTQEDYDYLINTEKIYLSFLMTSSKTLIDWIQEILRHIDAVIFYNYYTNKIEIKLIRGNYDLNDLISIDESDYSDLKITRKDYTDIKNKITLKYTHPETFNETSIVFNNEANTYNSNQEEEYDFNMVRNHDYAKTILKRLIKKECYPLAVFKLNLPAEIVEGTNDFNIKAGDVLLINNEQYNLINFQIRVLQIEAGSEEENVYEISCVEDIFDISSFDNLDFEVNTQEDINYSLIDLESTNIKIIDTPAEMSSLNNDSLLPIIVEDETDDEIVNGYFCQDGLTGRKRTIGYKGSYREVSTRFITNGKIIEREVDLIVKNTINFKEITGSEISLQRMKYTGIFENGEMFSLKSITDNDDDTYTISGMIRGLGNTEILNNHRVNTKIYFVLDGTVANSLKSLSILPSVNKSIYINKFNNRAIGNKVNKSHVYGYTLRKPYKPGNIKYIINGSDTTISFNYTKRLRGRNYRSPEIIVFGEDEGQKEEGIKYIIKHGSNTYETETNEITIPHVAGSFTIKASLSGYESEEETINII